MGRRLATSYLTAIYDAPNSRVSIDDAVLPNWQTANTTDALGSWTYAIGTGRDTEAQMGARMYVGKVRSVRVYSRILGAEELDERGVERRVVVEARDGVAVADALNISRQTYAKYEDKPELMPLGKAKAACFFIGVDINDVCFSADILA